MGLGTGKGADKVAVLHRYTGQSKSENQTILYSTEYTVMANRGIVSSFVLDKMETREKNDLLNRILIDREQLCSTFRLQRLSQPTYQPFFWRPFTRTLPYKVHGPLHMDDPKFVHEFCRLLIFIFKFY